MPNTAYVLFENVPLKRLHNKIPSITAAMAVQGVLDAERDGEFEVANTLKKLLKQRANIDFEELREFLPKT